MSIELSMVVMGCTDLRLCCKLVILEVGYMVYVEAPTTRKRATPCIHGYIRVANPLACTASKQCHSFAHVGQHAHKALLQSLCTT